MCYRDYKITNKWWKRKLAITVNSKELEFDTMQEMKEYVDVLYQ